MTFFPEIVTNKIQACVIGDDIENLDESYWSASSIGQLSVKSAYEVSAYRGDYNRKFGLKSGSWVFLTELELLFG